MAGLFERMGLVRTEYEGMPEIPMQPVSEPMYAPETPVIDATQVSYDDVIASIYQQGDIDDENSIFKIKAYIDILPQDMTKAKKQASIAGILSVNGINVDDLIEDGLKRGRALDAAEDSIGAENDALIAETEADIEHLKSLIEQAEARIEESKQKTSVPAPPPEGKRSYQSTLGVCERALPVRKEHSNGHCDWSGSGCICGSP